MTSVQAIRPLGESDLAGLRAHFDAVLGAWARDWITPETVIQILSVVSCKRSAHDADAMHDRAGFVLGSPGTVQVWSTHSSLERWARVFVLEGEKLSGDTRFESELSRLASCALADLVSRCIEGDKPIELEASDPWVDEEFPWGWDGIQIALQVGEHFAECHFARESVSRWIEPMQSPTQRLRSVKLPASLGNSPCKVSVNSQSFEMLASDFLTMQVGSVLSMDQPLDSAFQATLPDHPGLLLKAYPGRTEQTLAVEIFGN